MKTQNPGARFLLTPTLALLVAIGLAACGNDRLEAPAVGSSDPAKTVMQPGNMPAPAPAVEAAAPTAPPVAPTARDSAATKPLDTLNEKKESSSMPEAGHGNNHSSPALKKSSIETRPVPRKVRWV